MKVERTCKYCMKIFYADHWQVARNRGKFCSPQCVHEWTSEEFMGKKFKYSKKKKDGSENSRGTNT